MTTALVAFPFYNSVRGRSLVFWVIPDFQRQPAQIRNPGKTVAVPEDLTFSTLSDIGGSGGGELLPQRLSYEDSNQEFTIIGQFLCV